MTSTTASLPVSPTVPPVDWSNVRLVYKKLQDDFYRITEPFGISVLEETSLHLSHLIATIDSIDRNLDVLPERSERDEFSNALVVFLAGKTKKVESSVVTEEVQRRMHILRTVVETRGIQSDFCETVKTILVHTEAKRAARSEREMIDEMREEWRLTGHLTVLILRPESNDKFESFFYLCCEMMTAVDMIQDAISDYREGQISVFPWPTLYIRLLAEFIVPMPKLIWRFPKPSGLFRYAISFLYEVYWPFKFSTLT